MSTTIETFRALYGSASDAVKQRLDDVILGARIAMENKQDGSVHRDSEGDPAVSGDRPVDQKQEGR